MAPARRQRERAASSPDRPLPGSSYQIRSRSGHPQFADGSAGAVESTARRPVCRPITARHSSGPDALAEHVVRPAGHAGPGALGDLPGQLAGGPAGVPGEDPQAGELVRPGRPGRRRGRRGARRRRRGAAGCPSPAPAPGATARHSAVSVSHGPPTWNTPGSTARSHQPGSTSRISTWLGRPRTTPSVPVSEWSRT